jgi:cytochrome c oxidase assembly protein subunit 15
VKPLTVVLLLLLLQGIVGYIQWELELPSEIVWVHVALATCNWLAMLWTIAAAGRLVPRSGQRQADERGDAPPGRSASAPAGAGAGAA